MTTARRKIKENGRKPVRTNRKEKEKWGRTGKLRLGKKKQKQA